MSGAKIIELDNENTCKICDNALAKYSCPKCAIKYCSVQCYQSPQHLECSEEFYKSCITTELSLEGADTEENKRKILEILTRNRFDDDDHELDSDDDAEVDDIAQRLSGVDLDNAEAIWDKLTEDERQEFVAFLKSDDVTKYIPKWEPWWLYSSKIDDESFMQDCPNIIKVRDFKEISKKEPADCVKFNLVNVLAAYVFAARYFNGEYKEFAQEVITCIVTISLVFKENQNFEDYESAVKSVEFECTQSDWIVADVENFKLLRSDLEKLLKGPNSHNSKYYILAALSDLHNLFNLSSKRNSDKNAFSKAFPNNHFPSVKIQSRNKIKNCIRKVEYLLSYSKDIFSL